MEAQETLLAHRPNFTVVPRQPPHLDYTKATEQVCQKLNHQEVEELGSDINTIINILIHPSLTVTKQNTRLYNNLNGTFKIGDILTVDKGMAMVVLDK